MKKIFYLLAFLCSIVINAQTLGYNDLGILFSSDDYNGTARFRGMSGAFGSLGGDLSAIEINPAGAAVFLKGEFSTSVNFRNQTINSNYYGTTTSVENDFTNLSQIGGVFVLYSGTSKWKKTVIGFNYTLSKDFENRWVAKGNSNFPTFIYDGDDNLYLFSDGQIFDNYTSGKNSKYTFSIASQYSNELYLGASFNSHFINFYQSVSLKEDNHDGNGNTLMGSLFEELLTSGSGFSFSLGVISTPVENVRLGLAYQSPIWYNLYEDYVDSDGYVNGFSYSLNSPSKLTGSFAYIFNQFGLISLDYVFRNYSNTKLKPTYDFSEDNNTFKRDFKGTSEIRLGTEWIYKQLSFRGGYHYEQNPYKGATSSDNLTGYSFGLGYNFGNIKLDIAYEDSKHTDLYDFYPQYDEVNPADLDYNTSIITTTLVISLF